VSLKVAFDCSGTLLARDENTRAKVVALYKWFQSKGCSMVIWSNAYSYTQSAKEENELAGQAMMKFSKSYYDEDEDRQNYMDIAVDDEDQDYLAAKNFILVRDIPNDPAQFEEKFNYLLKSESQPCEFGKDS
jgi:hypothetical protein